MSYGARVTLATASELAAVGLAAVALTLGPQLPLGSWPFYCLAALCALIGIACLSPASRAATHCRTGLLVTFGYVYAQRDSENLTKALMAFAAFGLPAGYVAISGRYPTWGRYASVFHGDSAIRSDDDPSARSTATAR
jgi:hypothetical protein